MGILVENYEKLEEDYDEGFLFWNLGKRSFVAFERQAPDSTVPLYEHIPKELKFDRIFIGDFEVFDYFLKDGKLSINIKHEVWIPIKNVNNDCT